MNDRSPSGDERPWARLAKWPPIQRVVIILYSCLRWVVPTRRNQIAFISVPDYADNSRALFSAIMASPNAKTFRLVWLARDAAVSVERVRSDFPDGIPAQVRVIAKNSLRGLFWFLRSRYVFATHGTYRFVRSGVHQTIVNLWHGMPIKKLGAQIESVSRADLDFAHYSVSTSEFYATIIADAFLMEPQNVLVTGLPRNEWLLQPTPKHHALRGGHSQLVVWLPTFRLHNLNGYVFGDAADPSAGVSQEILADMDKKLDGADVLVLLKFHPADVRNSEQWPSYRNIRVMADGEFRRGGYDVYRLLACAEALITDYSSVAVDFLITGRPIGVFAPDRHAYTRGFIPGILEKLETFCHRLDTIDDMAAFVRELPPLRGSLTERDILHDHRLDTPSRDILRSVGLGEL